MIKCEVRRNEAQFELNGDSIQVISEIRVLNEALYRQLSGIYSKRGQQLTPDQYFMLTGFKPKFKGYTEVGEIDNWRNKK